LGRVSIQDAGKFLVLVRPFLGLGADADRQYKDCGDKGFAVHEKTFQFEIEP
jgi:hypothetical protein